MFGILLPYVPPLAEFRPLSSTDLTNSFTDVSEELQGKLVKYADPTDPETVCWGGAELQGLLS